MQRILSQTESLLASVFAKANVDSGHSVGHALKVTSHVAKAVEAEAAGSLRVDQRLSLLLAAMLHDADDHKFFPTHQAHENSVEILGKVLGDKESMEVEGTSINPASVVTTVTTIIDRVSTSKAKNAPAPEGQEWTLIVRWADRLEAIGEIGIVRCYTYNQHSGSPLFVETTPRVTTEEELATVATPERFARYTGGSDSMMDHYYDKLLHVGHLDGCSNSYLLAEAERRRQTMIDFVLAFGRTGTVDEEALAALAAAEDA
jgi:uncharacterized protein